MKYFTPELYVRFNSHDDDVADAADDEWEKQIKMYRKHYKRLERQLPEELRRFHNEQCLHDADVEGPLIVQPFSLPWSPRYAVIAARQINTLIPEFLNTVAVLFYEVTDEPVIEKSVSAPVFRSVQPIWLYEEEDVIKPGLFEQEILISDGRVIKIRFRDFHYSIVPLKQEAAAAEKPRKPARRAASA